MHKQVYMKHLTCIFLSSISMALHAQDYNVSLIPDSLKENANVVKRYEEITVIIKDIDKAVIRRKFAVTILHEQGNNDSWYNNYYSKLADLSDISGTLYDAAGKKLKSVKKKDIEDVAYEDGFSLMQDTRIKNHNFFYRQYPYTVEYEDEQTLYGILNLPGWEPVENLKMAVQQSRFSIDAPVGYKLRHKQFNYAGQPIVVNDKTTRYTWEVKNLKVYPTEYFHPDFHEITPSVFAAPTDFSYGGYTGNMSSWLEYGKYQVALNKGRDELPMDIKQTVHKLTDAISDPNEKIKVLYSFLQQNTRYISIQLGIGGLQPFDAKYVATKRYGDCKALSNYMHSLLAEAGIKGYFTTITAGENEKFYMADFPSDQGNHVIVCVPLAKDTVWLECTSQDKAAGYMGNFTDDRYALMIKDDGGYLVKTPRYTEKDNQQITRVNALLDETGKLTAGIHHTYTGLEQDDLFGIIKHYTKDKQLERLKSVIDIPTYDISSFNYEEHKAVIPSIDETINLEADNYATVSGKRFFVQPNILSKNSLKLNATDVRKYDIVYNYAFSYLDTVNIKIPAGYAVESMPKNIGLSNKFGTYNIHFAFEAENITYTRSYIRTKGRFPPADYAELVKFYEDMFKADRSRIVFVKKDG